MNLNFFSKNKGEKEKEKISDAREQLLILEKTGKFVFHGSAREIESLEPRQPYMGKTESGNEHGDPCVAATPFAEIAIFRAIVNLDNFPEIGYASSFGFDSDRGLNLKASQVVLDNLDGKGGFVYVLSKEGFEKFSGMEWRSAKSVNPVEVISVTSQDLPKGIKLYNLSLDD